MLLLLSFVIMTKVSTSTGYFTVSENERLTELQTLMEQSQTMTS